MALKTENRNQGIDNKTTQYAPQANKMYRRGIT